MEDEPRNFYSLEKIRQDVAEKINLAEQAKEPIDYCTFVPDGEPTLDMHLGKEIEQIQSLGIKVAVITNSSLIWHDSVRENLKKADWVSLKIDTVEENIWYQVNRPHRSLKLQKISDGIIEFARQYKGKLVTETMLVRDLNESEYQVRKLSNFMKQFANRTAYISIPIRPPAEKWVLPPTEDTLVRAYQIISGKVKNVEYLIGYEGNAFAFTGHVETDLLSITAVHPMREEAVSEFLNKAEANWSIVDRLIEKGVLVEKEFQGKKFYIRKLFVPRTNEVWESRIE